MVELYADGIEIGVNKMRLLCDNVSKVYFHTANAQELWAVKMHDCPWWRGPVYLPHDKESVWHISMINSHSWLWLYVRHVALSCYIVTENVNGKFIHLERLNMEYFHTRRYGILPSANVIIEEIIYKQ